MNHIRSIRHFKTSDPRTNKKENSMSHLHSRRLMQKVSNKLLKKWQAGCVYYWSHDLSSNYFTASKIVKNMLFSLFFGPWSNWNWAPSCVSTYYVNQIACIKTTKPRTEFIPGMHYQYGFRKNWELSKLRKCPNENWKSHFKLPEISRQHLPELVLLFVVLASLIQQASADLSNEIAATMPEVAG